ncbi:MAG: hypothetical protein GEV03_18400 [Streptosporangiales bacterium]|nr:hypothetical protein [Streptosporangiales bacterium]
MLRPGRTATIRVEGVGVTTPEPTVVGDLEAGAEHTAEVAVEVDPAYPPGTDRRVTVLAEPGLARDEADMVVAATGWTMFMVSHFHYDPVWWNTQAGFTATWYDLPGAEERRPPEVRTAFDLVRAHLDAARQDPDYKFVLAELDYLKPHWDAHPEDRADLRRLIADGRVEIVGGNYNEPNTNLTSTESTIRNAVYGIGFQRDVLGGDPLTAWMLDVFGHDPAYPGLMADAGLTSSSWARGPFHQWGPRHTVGDNRRMQFPSEFEWISPSGRGLLTSYMPNHYGAGWAMSGLSTLADAEAEAYRQFQDLKSVAATRNTLLPVGADHVIPSRWVTEIHRDWNRRYVWPRFVAAVPREFFAAARAEAREGGIPFTPQSRDMNPIYTGKDVSYIDTKQAQRAAETAVLDGERLSTLAALLGARYPSEALDKAWRQLVFGAHHDGITGSESDQVYLDLLGGWREAYELGDAVRTDAIDHIGAHADTRGEGRPILVVNTLSWPRDGVTDVTLTFPEPGTWGFEVRDDAGAAVPAALAGERRRGDGSLAEAVVTFVARKVPALGYRTYRAMPAGAPPAGWSRDGGTAIENEYFRVEADPARGGALASILDKRTGKEILRPGQVGNELVVSDEYPAHPEFAEGPWHLLPTGREQGSATLPAEVRVEVSPVGRRILSTWSLDDLRVTQEVVLWADVDRMDCRTHVDGSIGHDRLLRVRFPADVAGGRPVYEVGNAAVGRTFGFPRVDAAEQPWTYDNPAHTWVGTTSTARVAFDDEAAGALGARSCQAIGVAEVVAADVGSPAVRDLVAALAARGVTATCTSPNGPRYGASDVDSNLPDVRIALGGPDENPFTAAALAQAGPGYGERLGARLDAGKAARVWVPARRTRARTWVPNADLRGVLDLPVLVVAGADLDRAVAGLAEDLADAVIEVAGPAELAGGTEPPEDYLEDYSVALVNRGMPGCLVDPSGALYLSLMRSCSGWPSGVWIDPPRRTVPDGTSFSWQHWSHTFAYSLVAGRGDWRAAGFVQHGREFNHELLAHVVEPHPGPLPAVASLFEVEPREVVLTALKPRGNPLASGRPGGVELADGLTVRCYEAVGRPTDARIRCFVPLRDAAPADLLEEPRGAGADTGGVAAEAGELRLRLAPADTTTVTAVADPRAPEAEPGDLPLGPRGEPAQPVYARYWLHNKGPAPYGYLPLSVHVEPTEARAGPASGPDGAAALRVTVASSGTDGPRSGRVRLVAPPGFRIEPGGDLLYHLEPGEHAAFDLAVRTGDAPPGRYFLAARIGDELGQTLEDVVALDVGEPPPAGERELAVRVGAERVVLGPGEGDIIALYLDNRCQGEIRGEAQLLSPFGTWDALGPWTLGFAVGGGETARLRYDVRAPVAARPGEYWALVKVMYFGRLWYTEAIPITVADGPHHIP